MRKYNCRFHDSGTGKEILAESPEAAAEELVRQRDSTLSMPCATTVLNPWRVFVDDIMFTVKSTLSYRGKRA
jgi:hypothetical protein